MHVATTLQPAASVKVTKSGCNVTMGFRTQSEVFS